MTFFQGWLVFYFWFLAACNLIGTAVGVQEKNGGKFLVHLLLTGLDVWLALMTYDLVQHCR